MWDGPPLLFRLKHCYGSFKHCYIFLRFSSCTVKAFCLGRTVTTIPIIAELPLGRHCCNNLFHSLLYCRSPLSRHTVSWAQHKHNYAAALFTESSNERSCEPLPSRCRFECQDIFLYVWGCRQEEVLCCCTSSERVKHFHHRRAEAVCTQHSHP